MIVLMILYFIGFIAAVALAIRVGTLVAEWLEEK